MLDTVICHVDTCICLLLQAIANVALFYQISSQLEKVEHSVVFSDVRNFVHTPILLSPSCSGYPIYPKYKFSSQSEQVKNSAVYSDGRNFAHIQILLSPSFSKYLIHPKYTISSQSDKVEISRIQWISCENEKSQNFFIIAIVLRIPDLPHKQNFKLIGQSWKFGHFFRTVEISLTHKFYYHHHFQDTRYTQDTKFQANRTRLKFREFSEFRAKTKNRRIFLLVPLYSEYPIYPIYKISSESDKVENSTFFRTAEISRIQLSRKIQVVHADLQTFI